MKKILEIEHAVFILLVFVAGCASAQGNNVLYKKSEASESVKKGWQALNEKEYEKAHQISDQCIALYSEKSKQLNKECNINNSEEYDVCQLLNDTAQCFFIKAKAYSDTEKLKEAREVCNELKKYYFNAFVFDPRGWPWRPSDACNF